MCHVVVEPRRHSSGTIYRVLFIDVFGRAQPEWIACGLWLPTEGIAAWQVEELPLATQAEVDSELSRDDARTGGLERIY